MQIGLIGLGRMGFNLALNYENTSPSAPIIVQAPFLAPSIPPLVPTSTKSIPFNFKDSYLSNVSL